jgi:hypothetical protein
MVSVVVLGGPESLAPAGRFVAWVLAEAITFTQPESLSQQQSNRAAKLPQKCRVKGIDLLG